MVPPEKPSSAIVDGSVVDPSVNVPELIANPPDPPALTPRTEMFVPEKVTAPVIVDGIQAKSVAPGTRCVVGVVASSQFAAVEKRPPAVLLKLTVQVGDAAAVPLYPTIDAMPPTPESPSTRALKAKIPFRRTGPTVHRPLVVLVESPEDPKLCRGEAKRSECNVQHPLRPPNVTVRHCPLNFVHHTTAAREGRPVQCHLLI